MESLFIYYVTFSPLFTELLILWFLVTQMVYLVLFTNHFFFGNLILGISANSFLSIFLGGLLLNFFSFSDPFYESLNSHISVNSTSLIIKGFMIFSSLVTVLFSFSFLRLKNIKQYEFSLLILFSISGLMFTALSADILAVFMSLELQGLAFYLLATFYSNSEFNTEVGLKYFVLASFSSAILLFGFSLIYVILGSTSFETIQLLSNQHYNSDIIFLSLVFSFSAFLFKVGAAPFHMWLCDIYEGSLTSVTLFFATAPKLIIFNILITTLFSIFLFDNFYWSIFCQISGTLSVALASIAALFQKKTKRLLAFSAISHSGFILLSLSCFSIFSLKTAFFYLVVYVFTNLSIFAVLLAATRVHVLKYLVNWSDFSNRNSSLGLAFATLLFSISGIPPLAGFYSKLLVMLSLIYQSQNLIALFAAFFSCVSCYYYIRLIKILFFSGSSSGAWVSSQTRLLELGTVIFTTTIVFLIIFSDFALLLSTIFAMSFF